MSFSNVNDSSLFMYLYTSMFKYIIFDLSLDKKIILIFDSSDPIINKSVMQGRVNV